MYVCVCMSVCGLSARPFSILGIKPPTEYFVERCYARELSNVGRMVDDLDS